MLLESRYILIPVLTFTVLFFFRLLLLSSLERFELQASLSQRFIVVLRQTIRHIRQEIYCCENHKSTQINIDTNPCPATNSNPLPCSVSVAQDCASQTASGTGEEYLTSVSVITQVLGYTLDGFSPF